jgi:hypothetical protein
MWTDGRGGWNGTDGTEQVERNGTERNRWNGTERPRKTRLKRNNNEMVRYR